MLGPYKPYVPKNISELIDLLCSMMLQSPTFEDKTGHFPGKGVDTTFHALNESLQLIRKRIGEERYIELRDMSDRMRAHFEADPGGTSDDTLKGCRIIDQMIELLKQRVRKS